MSFHEDLRMRYELAINVVRMVVDWELVINVVRMVVDWECASVCHCK